MISASKPNHLPRWRRRAVVASLSVSICSFTAAVATTVHLDFSHDDETCSAFVRMVKSANVAQLSDEQLCDFRFSRLPSSETQGFNFPEWKPLPTSDALATYFMLLKANVPPNSPFNMGYPWPDLMAAGRVGAEEKNLVFSTFQTKLQGEGPLLTFVQMDIKQCSKGLYKSAIRKSAFQMQPYVKNIGLPFFSTYSQPDIQDAIPVMPAPFGGAQIALWRNTIPIQLTIGNSWVLGGWAKRWNLLTLDGLKKVKTSGASSGQIAAYPICQIQIY